MNLQKRDCSTKISLRPCGADILEVTWNIGEDQHYFYPSIVMGTQFGGLMGAVFSLYTEDEDSHKDVHRKWRFVDPPDGTDRDPGQSWVEMTNSVRWDEEGSIIDIYLSRTYRHHHPLEDGPVTVEIIYKEGHFIYSLDGRDLCYAIAKAFTEVIKEYGIFGYHLSTGGNCYGYGDSFSPNELLFLKAYALNAMEAREVRTIWEEEDSWEHGVGSSFEKEVELLLFDM